MDIIGRTNEVALLNKYASSNKPEFVAVYGRRRVGKTFLITQTLESQMIFETSGVIMGEKEDQFAAFYQSLRRIGYEGPTLTNWMEAFLYNPFSIYKLLEI